MNLFFKVYRVYFILSAMRPSTTLNAIIDAR